MGEKKGMQTSEFQMGALLTVFMAAKEKLGIDFMDPEAMTAITFIAVAYILGRSAVKVAAVMKG